MKHGSLGRLGIKATKIYLILLFTAVPALAFLGAIELQPIRINELGDFLAGAFGPLAIFWLVLGFFQQGEELKNSVETLKLQAKELANSVEQQRELVVASREAVTLERENRLAAIRPRILLIGGGRSGGPNGTRIGVNLKNVGWEALDLSVDIKPTNPSVTGALHFSHLEKGAGGKFHFEQYGNENELNQEIRLSYRDVEGNRYQESFLVKSKFEGRPPIQIIEQ